MASIALAKRLKQVAPRTPIILGGYALQGEPGYTVGNAFPWIDLIVTGDGEQAIVEIALAILTCKSIAARANTPAKIVTTAPVNLEDTPIPDYDDWFLDLERLVERDKITINTQALPVESSRGCWWGEKRHCIFCGIDNDTLKFRHKSTSKTISMLAQMRERYGDYIFRFSDYIMPKEYYTTLLPVLAAEDRKYRLHTEVKANHPPDRIRLFSEAGFREIQPGIESFSTPVLKEMGKGVRAIDNVSVLKAGYLYEVVVNYNILFGIPGDAAPAYRAMLRNVPQLYHLIPPVSCDDVAITRFSPLHSEWWRFGFDKSHVHHPLYNVLFSKDFLSRSGFCLDSYAYYFEGGLQYSEELAIIYDQLRQQVGHWKALHRERFVQLSYAVFEGQVSIVDSRYGEECRYCLSPEGSAVYLACDTRPTKLSRIQSELESEVGGSSTSVLTDAVDELMARRLVWVEDDFIFGLAVPHAVSAERERSGWRRRWVSPWL
jgi:ribosomal peptide maturation radical SAM protein 1